MRLRGMTAVPGDVRCVAYSLLRLVRRDHGDNARALGGLAHAPLSRPAAEPAEDRRPFDCGYDP